MDVVPVAQERDAFRTLWGSGWERRWPGHHDLGRRQRSLVAQTGSDTLTGPQDGIKDAWRERRCLSEEEGTGKQKRRAARRRASARRRGALARGTTQVSECQRRWRWKERSRPYRIRMWKP